MPGRFAILHHLTGDGEHWDLMLEHGCVLLTWQLTEDPFGSTPWPRMARRIGDHRKRYLDYEGTIEGDRGRVVRVASGYVIFEEFTANNLTVRLSGRQLKGRFSLRQTGVGEESWTFAVD